MGFLAFARARREKHRPLAEQAAQRLRASASSRPGGVDVELQVAGHLDAVRPQRAQPLRVRGALRPDRGEVVQRRARERARRQA